MEPPSTATSAWVLLNSPRQGEPAPPATLPATPPGAVTLGVNDRLVGKLYIEGDLQVNGSLEGEVEATGYVNLAEAARVSATVVGRAVTISGRVNGAVTASDKLVIERTGSLAGDVRVPRLVIRDGARINGNVSMSPTVDASPKSKGKGT